MSQVISASMPLGYAERNGQYWRRNLAVCLVGSFTTIVAMTLLLPFLVGLGVGGVTLTQPVLRQFLVQVEGVAATAVWSVLATVVLVKITQWLVGLRVDPEHETQGLDFTAHGETAYNLNQ